MENPTGTRKSVQNFINSEKISEDMELYICDTDGELIVEADIAMLRKLYPSILLGEVSTFNKYVHKCYVEVIRQSLTRTLLK